jgi:hypothetical protein
MGFPDQAINLSFPSKTPNSGVAKHHHSDGFRMNCVYS